jgi:hypothetical protein
MARAGRLAATVAIALIGGALLLPGLAVAAPNPPGDNGTVKLDARPFDRAPDNEPHVGCTFQVDFYGYDEGDLHAQVTFEAQPPTLRDGGGQVLLTDTVFIGEDDNSGGGTRPAWTPGRPTGWTFTGITAHPEQGFHVKLTVNAEGSQGADTKHKVFWVTGCTGYPGGSAPAS